MGLDGPRTQRQYGIGPAGLTYPLALLHDANPCSLLVFQNSATLATCIPLECFYTGIYNIENAINVLNISSIIFHFYYFLVKERNGLLRRIQFLDEFIEINGSLNLKIIKIKVSKLQ